MLNYVNQFPGDVNKNDMKLLRYLSLIDVNGKCVFGVGYKDFINMKPGTSLEPQQPQIDKKKKKEHDKVFNDDMKQRIALKNYLKQKEKN